MITKSFLLFMIIEAMNTYISDTAELYIALIAMSLLHLLLIIYLIKSYKNIVLESCDKRKRINGMNILWFILIVVCYSIAQEGLLIFFIPNHEVKFDVNIISVIHAIILAPICEEVLFRGIMLGQLTKKYGFLKANLFQAMLFAVLHFDYEAIIFYFVFGLMMGLIIKYLNIYFAMIWHSFNNIWATLVLAYGLELKMDIPKYGNLLIGITFLIINIYLVNVLRRFREN